MKIMKGVQVAVLLILLSCTLAPAVLASNTLPITVKGSSSKHDDWQSGYLKGLTLYDRLGFRTGYEVHSFDATKEEGDKNAWSQNIVFMQSAESCGPLDAQPYNKNQKCRSKSDRIFGSSGHLSTVTSNVAVNPSYEGFGGVPLIGGTPNHDSSAVTLRDFKPAIVTVAEITLVATIPELEWGLNAAAIAAALIGAYDNHDSSVDHHWVIEFDHTTGFLDLPTAESAHVMRVKAATKTKDPADPNSGTLCAGFTYESSVFVHNGVYNPTETDTLVFEHPAIPPGRSFNPEDPAFFFRLAKSKSCETGVSFLEIDDATPPQREMSEEFEDLLDAWE